jgi:hypothetical protein
MLTLVEQHLIKVNDASFEEIERPPLRLRVFTTFATIRSSNLGVLGWLLSLQRTLPSAEREPGLLGTTWQSQPTGAQVVGSQLAGGPNVVVSH